MDANRTRYSLLLGQADWQRDARWQDVAWEPRSESLTLAGLPFRFATAEADRRPRLSDRRGAAADRFGNWYWIARDAHELRVRSVGDGLVGHFWAAGDGEPRPPRAAPDFAPAEPPAPPAPVTLAGLAVTEEHYLLAGELDAPGLLVFDLRAGGGPVRAPWPLDVPFAPFDLASAKGGGAWILDRENRVLWELDRRLAIAGRTDLDAGGGEPVAIDTDDDGSVYLLIRDAGGPSRLRVLPDGPEWTLAEQDVASVDGHDIAVAGARVYVADAAGNQAYAFDRDGDGLKLARAFFPMRLFGGNALAMGPDGPYYDSGEVLVPLIEQHRPRFALEGTVQTRVFDAAVPGTVWHRLLLDGWLGAAVAVRAESRCADERDLLDAAPWMLEPAPIRRASGPELPFVRLRDAGSLATYELLFQRARGRFLQLRLRLSGDGRSTPRLRAARVWYGRFSYLERYLPKVYREDADSASFLDRYLANPEGILTGIEDAVAAAQALFDPRTAPGDALDWLAGFFDVALDTAWDEARRRLFLAHALDFFAWRGTIRGLQTALALAFDPCAGAALFDASGDAERGAAARIVERFRLRRMPALVLGDPTSGEGPRLTPGADRWTPEQGGDELDRRYADYVDAAGAHFPLDPAAAPSRAVWARFADDVLGFEPAAGAADGPVWQAFLRRRYRTVDALNAAYGAGYAAFEDVPVPASLPRDGAPLVDWYRLETIVLPSRRLAHRFTVLLPVSPSVTGEDLEARRALAQRIVDLHKPAHTAFTVRFYWAAFRVGEVRLGSDTIVDLGSRAPALLAPAVVGRSALGESTVAGIPPTPLAPTRQERP